MCVFVCIRVCVCVCVCVLACDVYTGRAGTGMKVLPLPPTELQVVSEIVLPVYLQKGGGFWLSKIILCVKNWQVINHNIIFN